MHLSTENGTGMTKTRKGRKRKEGRRYASGDAVREVHTPPTAIRRLREAALAGMQDARWGTELGRLFLLNRLTADQYNAGCRWEVLAIRHRAALGAKSGLPSPSDFGRTNGTPCDPESESGVLEAKRHLMDLDRYQKALMVLAARGVNVTRAVKALCEEGLILDTESFCHAVAGLDALMAANFGLTNRKK